MNITAAIVGIMNICLSFMELYGSLYGLLLMPLGIYWGFLYVPALCELMAVKVYTNKKKHHTLSLMVNSVYLTFYAFLLAWKNVFLGLVKCFRYLLDNSKVLREKIEKIINEKEENTSEGNSPFLGEVKVGEV